MVMHPPLFCKNQYSPLVHKDTIFGGEGGGLFSGGGV